MSYVNRIDVTTPMTTSPSLRVRLTLMRRPSASAAPPSSTSRAVEIVQTGGRRDGRVRGPSVRACRAGCRERIEVLASDANFPQFSRQIPPIRSSRRSQKTRSLNNCVFVFFVQRVMRVAELLQAVAVELFFAELFPFPPVCCVRRSISAR